jgi:hypothetical protein
VLVGTCRVGLGMLGIRHGTVDFEVMSVPVPEDPLQLW